jgi:hypothetical protein
MKWPVQIYTSFLYALVIILNDLEWKSFCTQLSMHIENYCCMQMVYHVMDHLNTTKC